MATTETVSLALDSTMSRSIKLGIRKGWKGEQLVRVTAESGKFIFLVSEQSKSILPDKAFVNSAAFLNLEASAGIHARVEVAKENFRTIKMITLKVVKGGDFTSFQNSPGVLVYLKKAMLGWVVGDQEIFELSVLGKRRVFQAAFAKGSELFTHGVVTKNTEIGFEKTSEPAKVAGFAKVGGLHSVVEELVSLVKRPLLEPEVYARYGLRPPQGILLYGTPGCGKSLLAQALAEELPNTLVRFFKASEIADAQAIHEAFRDIRKTIGDSRVETSDDSTIKKGFQGALMFIDEIDALAPRREEASEAERRAVAALLTEMEDKKFPIIVLGATNRVNHIDIALRRAGRFEREIEIPVPNEQSRAEILGVLLKSGFPEELVAGLIDKTHEISRNTQGFVGADLRQLLNRAAAKTMEQSHTEILLSTVLDIARRMRPSSLKALHVEIPRTKFSDVGGYEEAKQQLKEAVEWPLRYERYFRCLGISPPAGILLYGVPGCSKTMLARAVASESRMNFISVKGPELFNKYVGESEAAVREVFRKAREAAPCVVFFDEIDALGTARGSSESAVSDRVLAQLLTEMDGVGEKKSVVVIGATNRPEALDPALLRPGRLDRLVHIGLPDSHAREQIWRGFVTRTKNLDSASFDLDAAVLRTEGYTGAECVMVAREAGMLAVREFISIDQQLANQIERLSLDTVSAQALEPVIHWRHIEQALGVVRPRIDYATVAKFESFAKAHSN